MKLMELNNQARMEMITFAALFTSLYYETLIFLWIYFTAWNTVLKFLNLLYNKPMLSTYNGLGSEQITFKKFNDHILKHLTAFNCTK